MPTRLTTKLPALAFATEIEDLEFSSDTPGTPCHISITLGGAEVLDTYLTPDAAGHFALNDLGWLISTHATAAMASRGKWLTELRIEADSKLLATVSIMPCRQRLYINGADFVQRSFLTLAGGGCKVVPKLARERLVWMPSAEERKLERPVSVRVTYMDLNTGETRRIGSEFRAEEYNDELLCYNTSPGYIVALEQFGPLTGRTSQPVGYDVTVGQRTMRYRLAPWDMDAAPVTTLDFTNVFGLNDTLYIYGEVEETLKPTYTQVVVGGSAYNANVEAQAEFKATTGALSAADVALLKDVATARYVWHDDSAVTITAAEVKGSNAYNTADSATLTWRESQSGLSVLTPLPVRTFDLTFDETFL